jgi:hypothetical protein
MRRVRLLLAIVVPAAVLAFGSPARAEYHPTLGRWMQRDPLGYVDGMGLYEYCVSAAVGMVDPYGLGLIGPEDSEWDGPRWKFDPEFTQEPGFSYDDGIVREPQTERPCPQEAKSGQAIGAQGTPGDFPHLPPGYDPKTWDFDPNRNYDPSNPRNQPGNFRDPDGRRWQWDPDPSGKHGHRPHWDVDPPNGKKPDRIRFLPDGKVLDDTAKVVVTGLALKAIWGAMGDLGKLLERLMPLDKALSPLFLIFPLPPGVLPLDPPPPLPQGEPVVT